MSFLKRNKLAVALVAVIAVVGGAAHFSGMTCCGGGSCAITSLFSASTAYAGPGCSASKSGTCDADSKVSATTASATSTEGKTCNKEDCIKAIMAEKKISHAEAEVVFANASASGTCHGASQTASVTTASASGCTGTASTASASGCSASKASAQLTSGSGCSASAQTASASGSCSASKASATTASASGCSGGSMTASLVNATEGKTCGDKEACIAKCMAEKGYSRAQAEECYAKCQSAKATQANVITGSSFTRDSWIDAKVASGMTRPEAEVDAAKAEASGEVKFVSATEVSGCSASKASATGGSCCASKAAATTAKVEETKPAAATTTSASTGGSN